MATKNEKAKESGALFFVNLLGKFVGIMQRLLSVSLFNFLKKWILLIGQWGFYAASGISLLAGIIGAIRGGGIRVLFTALGFSIGFFVVQYVGNKFLFAGDVLIDKNPSRMSSSAFLDSFALLSIIGGVGILLYNIYLAIKIPSFSPLLMGLVFFLLLWFFAFVLMNPKEITVSIVKDTTAGQEAIGIITLFIKSIMKLVPIIFGIGVIYGSISMLIHMFGLFKANPQVAWFKISSFNISSDMSILIITGLLPLLAYLGFVIAFLFIDITRAILSIPEKLEQLIKKS